MAEVEDQGVEESERELTFGEKAVGLSFNPSKDPNVQQLKESYAGLIDELDTFRNEFVSPEVKRMISVAITELQTSQMWAVKAVTWKEQ